MSLICLGLDGATWRNLEEWIKRGNLPNLAALANSGTKGTLQSTIPCTTVPAVPALTTGKNPANLGLFNFTHPDGSIIDSSDIEPPAIWDAIEPDKRSLIANLRSTYPPYNINGTMIAGDLFLPSGVNDYVTPISRCDELYSFHDDERQSRWNRLARSPDDNADELLNLAREVVRDKYRHFERLWQEDHYDFGLFWIGKTDSIQHHFWHDQDRVRSFYESIDEIIGRIRENIAPDNLIILSDHGFGKVPDRRFHVNTWLQREGYLSVTGGRAGAAISGITQQLLIKHVPKSALRTAHTAIYGDSNNNKNDSSPDDSERVLEPAFGTMPGIDRPTSRAKLTHPWGITVSTGDDRVSDDIINQLRALQDDRGEPVIQDAWRREKVFTGPYLDQVPDIVFLTTERYRAVPQLSRSLFTKRSSRRKIGEHPVTGEHNAMRDGIIVLNGSDFVSVDDVSVDITEIAPTLVHLLKSAVPESMDSTVRTDLLLTNRPVKHVKSDMSRREETTRSNTDKHDIKQRLQNLGYLENE